MVALGFGAKALTVSRGILALQPGGRGLMVRSKVFTEHPIAIPVRAEWGTAARLAVAVAGVAAVQARSPGVMEATEQSALSGPAQLAHSHRPMSAHHKEKTTCLQRLKMVW